jgi:hypothetical protein
MSKTKDGSTLGDHLRAAERARPGAARGVLDVELPEKLVFIWRWFVELSGTRYHSMGAYLPIQYAEIDAWSRLHGIALKAWHIRAIRAMDSAFLRAMATEAHLEDLDE